MLNCYSKKCFTGIIILMFMLAHTSYAAMRDTTAQHKIQAPGWVTGTVVNQYHRTLKDVEVSVKGNAAFTKTDSVGHFEIKAADGSTLIFKLHDYYTTKKVVGIDKDTTIRLLDSYLKSPDNIDVLYGTQSAESELGAVSTIYTNQLTTTPASLYVYALPGQLPGLYTQQISGFTSFNTTSLTTGGVDGLSHVNSTAINSRPSDNTEITLSLRGQTPVTIIDGVQRDISSIDPESIESISVLKDALSCILLGINSSSGILLVTTKKAEAGKPRISFTAESGIQTPLGLPTPLPAYQYAYLYNEALSNDGQNPYYTAADFNAYKNGTDPYGHPNVNWFNTILNKNAPENSYKLNVDGGTDVAKYNIGISYFDQEGIFNQAAGSTYNTNNNLSRYIINSDIQVQVNKKLGVDLQLFGRVQQSTEPGGGTSNILSALYYTPNNAYPLFNPNGTFGGSTLGAAFTNNLLAMTEYSGYIQDNTNDILANLALNYDLNSVTKGLTLKLNGNLSYETENSLNRSLQNPSYSYKDSVYSALGSTVAQSNTFGTVYTERQTFAQAALNYNRQFGKNGLSLILLDDTKSLNSNYDLSAVTSDRALKASYNYDGKYFAEGAINNSGYNRYTPGNQFGMFYAGGLGWQMGKESFIKDNIDWITSWTWRATYGKTGNNNIDSYSYYGYAQTYSTGSSSYAYFTGTGRAQNYAYYENPIANPYLSWENADKLDIGTDISLFKDHLQITADYYHDKYYDLLQVTGSPTAILGTAYPYQNLGINLYQGVEFSATYRNNYDKFNYFITGNISTQASKVIYADEETTLYPWQRYTGLPVDALFGYVAQGIYQNATQAANAPTYLNYKPKAGDIKLEDLNGDGVINQFDEKPIGNLKPLVFYGATFGFNYLGFSFSVILQGVFNREINTDNRVNIPFQGVGGLGAPPQGQAYQNATARWTPETASTAQLPELSFVNGTINGYNSQFSSFYLKSGDYLRVKNAEIGYTLPDAWAKKVKFSSIRVFVNGENLFTVAGYGGYDPEVGPDAYPIERVINAGISVKL
ncbi:SusC/RagA family TonB-linked outer membrane protein [Mucilaginibacter sp.]